MHTAAHETGRVLGAAKDGAFCMEVRVMIKQVSRWRALRGFRKTLEDDHD